MWTTPRTYVAGELMTAAILNTHVRDNLSLLKTSITDDGLEWRGGVRLANGIYLRGRNAAGSADIDLIRATSTDEIGIGKGINFPSTQVASSNVNTLDDYEEGTFTPVLGGSGGTSGQSYSNQAGSYIKIGKKVWYSALLGFSNKGTITGNLQLQGLPFTAAGNDSPGQVIWFSLATTWVSVAVRITGGTTTGGILGAAAAATSSVTALTTADVNNSTLVYMSGCYQASA